MNKLDLEYILNNWKKVIEREMKQEQKLKTKQRLE